MIGFQSTASDITSYDSDGHFVGLVWYLARWQKVHWHRDLFLFFWDGKALTFSFSRVGLRARYIGYVETPPRIAISTAVPFVCRVASPKREGRSLMESSASEASTDEMGRKASKSNPVYSHCQSHTNKQILHNGSKSKRRKKNNKHNKVICFFKNLIASPLVFTMVGEQ